MASILLRLLLLLLVQDVASSDQPLSDLDALPTLDVRTMQQTVMKHDKVVLLMHAAGCERAEGFAPTLNRIASEVPELAYGRVDVGADPKRTAMAAKGISVGAPALKAFFRNAPPTRRVLEYQGQPSYDAVLSWARAVAAWDGSDTLAHGWEIGSGNGRDQGGSKDEV